MWQVVLFMLFLIAHSIQHSISLARTCLFLTGKLTQTDYMETLAAVFWSQQMIRLWWHALRSQPVLLHQLLACFNGFISGIKAQILIVFHAEVFKYLMMSTKRNCSIMKIRRWFFRDRLIICSVRLSLIFIFYISHIIPKESSKLRFWAFMSHYMNHIMLHKSDLLLL